MLSLDTETTGTDLHHTAQPFFVTICKEDGQQSYWQWDVTGKRTIKVIKEDVNEILELVRTEDRLVLQNTKFDVAALTTLDSRFSTQWPWERTYDTLLAGHLLASNHPHDLTSMASEYLGIDIEPYELRLKAACTEARRIARRSFPSWKIASKKLQETPSAKDSCWKYDMWLPRALATYANKPSWKTVLADYSNSDSSVTMLLWKAQEAQLKARGLWKIYLERLKVLPVAYAMEKHGVTVSGTRLEELATSYTQESAEAGRLCINLAKGYGIDLKLPKSGNNKSLSSFLFEKGLGLGLPAVKSSKKTGKPSLDKASLEHYQDTLPPRSKSLLFIKSLKKKRKLDTAVAYMEGYKKFWIPTDKIDWFLLHPSINPTGTDTLRWSSNNPNSQNISKQEGFNLRYCFGPAPGREWWSLDARNLELRIPAYEADEKDVVDIFNRPADPPYFGSYHLAIFDLLYPKLYKEHGQRCKTLFESTYYQWVKNGNFAVLYGAQEETADRTYHVQGAFKRIRSRFPKIAKLSEFYMEQASRLGYVTTVPDRSVDPKYGYPLICTRSEYGKVVPTIPLNYHVSGTAMWWMARGMVRSHEQLVRWNLEHFDGHLILQVHDELVLDTPYKRNMGNLPRIHKIRRLMEQGGDDIGVPTPVSIEYHKDNWSTGVVL